MNTLEDKTILEMYYEDFLKEERITRLSDLPVDLLIYIEKSEGYQVYKKAYRIGYGKGWSHGYSQKIKTKEAEQRTISIIVAIIYLIIMAFALIFTS